MHFAGACGSIREELKPLLTEDDVELLLIAKWKDVRVALPPIDRRGQPPCHGKHLGIQIDADNGSCRAEAFLREPRNDTRAASDIENAVTWPEINVSKQRFDPRREEPAHKHLLVDLGETRL
jgi:hypothetical protein